MIGTPVAGGNQGGRKRTVVEDQKSDHPATPFPLGKISHHDFARLGDRVTHEFSRRTTCHVLGWAFGAAVPLRRVCAAQTHPPLTWR